jgi:hypothetical protein
MPLCGHPIAEINNADKTDMQKIAQKIIALD